MGARTAGPGSRPCRARARQTYPGRAPRRPGRRPDGARGPATLPCPPASPACRPDARDIARPGKLTPASPSAAKSPCSRMSPPAVPGQFILFDTPGHVRGSRSHSFSRISSLVHQNIETIYSRTRRFRPVLAYILRVLMHIAVATIMIRVTTTIVIVIAATMHRHCYFLGGGLILLLTHPVFFSLFFSFFSLLFHHQDVVSFDCTSCCIF